VPIITRAQPTYASIDRKAIAAITVRVIADGRGPEDGFSEYNLYGTPAGRWGDYGAAALDGDRIWIASEYIGQSCTLAEYANPASLFNCNGTRVTLTNWGTRAEFDRS